MRLAALAAILLPALAGASDRLAVELLSTEQPIDGAFAYERACWRLGADLGGVGVLQPFDFDGARWVRLAVEGGPWAQRCMEAFDPGRRGVDGTVTWFDGFAGGLVVPAGEDEQRVPDTVWYDAERVAPAAEADRSLVDAIASGDAEALARGLALGPEESLAVVGALAFRGEPRDAVALEAFARKAPHWRVRRAAATALDAALAFELLRTLLKDDPSWEVRHGVAERLGGLAGAPLALAGPRADEAARVLRGLVTTDPAWEVRRVALWQLSTGQLSDGGDALRDAVLSDAAPHVRAAGLEVLTGAGLVDAGRQVVLLGDPASEVRAMAAYLLARAPTSRTAAQLWTAMNDPSRAVRIAASGLLPHVETDGLEETLWALFVDEAEHVDAQTDYLVRLADALGRRPSVTLARAVTTRLDGQLSPTERRVLSRLYARIAPTEALARFVGELTAAEPSTRSIAADAVPDTPDTRATRFALLDAPDADVRAGAVLGLCRIPGVALDEARRDAIDLAPSPLGLAAAQALARCGLGEEHPPRLDVVLAAGAAGSPAPRSPWPALVAFALLVASIVGLRLSARAA